MNPRVAESSNGLNFVGQYEPVGGVTPSSAGGAGSSGRSRDDGWRADGQSVLGLVGRVDRSLGGAWWWSACRVLIVGGGSGRAGARRRAGTDGADVVVADGAVSRLGSYSRIVTVTGKWSL
jgi:hypothetical protein